MKKDIKAEDTIEKAVNENNGQDIKEDNCCCKAGSCSEDRGSSCEEAAGTSETHDLQAELREKSRQCEEYFQKLQRSAAEFDNYKKRTAREKEAIYIDALYDTFKAFLPVVDSIDRALVTCSEDTGSDSLKEGIELIYRQIKDVMEKLDIHEIKGSGEKFNPELHNAVMHIEDDSYDTNVIVEEFQKGYTYKDKVIRYSMVKVAN